MTTPALPASLDRFTFDRLLTTLLFVAIAVAACLMPAQNDTWWQLRAGQEMWRVHGVLLRDTFSHTAYGAFWPNHEWLSQTLFYAVFAAGGLPLLTLSAAAAITAAWAIVWRQTPTSPRTRFLLVAGVLLSACSTWSPRPQVFSLLLVATTIALVRRRRYAWLPAVFLLWANLHGAVVMGVWVLGACVAAAVVEDPAAARRLAAAVALSVLATLATPLGLGYWRDIVASLGRIRQLGIYEWAPPRVDDPANIPFWVAAAALIVLAAARGRKVWSDPDARADGRLTLCASAIALIPLALTASRNVPPFLMAAVPAIGALLPPRAQEGRIARVERPRMNAAVAATACGAAVAALVVSYARSAPHLAWAPLPRASLAALESCPGNLYNRYDEGGYLLWFAPDRKVFLDGRQDPYSPALIAEQVHVETTGDFAPTFKRYGIRCAYMPAESLVTARLVEAGWRPLYRDARWAVLAN